ncbi:MAG: hypothetical protein PHF86_00590 [Candidatus Nanoarchaeia archaeon]|nr:hypothetical protein [Candidatus Nanoarchaeia archaeon]
MAIKKLALTINAFDSSELLHDLILEIRDQIDWVAAIYQKKSYWKNPMDKKDLEELHRLKDIGLIDELIEFKPNYTKYSREQECDKRNMGIQLMKSRGFSHILNIDADEYYDADQFRTAKEMINKNGWPITYCSYVNYYKDFEHYLVYPFRPFVPFIHSTFFNYTYNTSAPGPTDPTRRIDNPFNLGTYLFEDETIRMGHAAWIRRDIRKKLINWSAKNFFSEKLINEAVKRWENWKEGEDAIMLFNVPENSVKVKKLETKIHKFEVPWLKEKKEA